MEINADFSLRVLSLATDARFVPSPAAGVERRMLDRIGGEVARATSIVHYAPESRFDRHTHEAGEEFLVLDGIFSDEFGDYPKGTYVRNPPGSAHAPRSAEGCTIFVKLRQFAADDKERVVLNTQAASWSPGRVAGLSVLTLHTFGQEQIELMRFAPGTYYPMHVHDGGEEILVLEGLLEDEDGTYPEGSWLRNPHGSRHTPFSKAGCLIYVKSGHLPRIAKRERQASS